MCAPQTSQKDAIFHPNFTINTPLEAQRTFAPEKLRRGGPLLKEATPYRLIPKQNPFFQGQTCQAKKFQVSNPRFFFKTNL